LGSSTLQDFQRLQAFIIFLIDVLGFAGIFDGSGMRMPVCSWRAGKLNGCLSIPWVCCS